MTRAQAVRRATTYDPAPEPNGISAEELVAFVRAVPHRTAARRAHQRRRGRERRRRLARLAAERRRAAAAQEAP